MKKVLFTFGTRPEAIKMAPLINEFKNRSEYFETKVCLTAQHREMLDQVISLFDIPYDYDLDLMTHNQGLNEMTQSIIKKVGNILREYQPDLVFVQGDTTTTFATALACFYEKIPVGHVEAGLRSFQKYDPFPEEMNRCLTSSLSELHFAPTAISESNLVREGYPQNKIFITGNTIVDALYSIKNSTPKFNDPRLQALGYSKDQKLILITTHRRENFGNKIQGMLKALKKLAMENPDVKFVFPIHPNPNIRNTVRNIMNNVENIILTDPLNYVEFINLLGKSYFVVTDSGGVQEEAPYLNCPVLLMRNTTERGEGVESGSVKMVGTCPETLLKEANRLLTDEEYRQMMAFRPTSYGDGNASVLIADIVSKYFQMDNVSEELYG